MTSSSSLDKLGQLSLRPGVGRSSNSSVSSGSGGALGSVSSPVASRAGNARFSSLSTKLNSLLSQTTKSKKGNNAKAKPTTRWYSGGFLDDEPTAPAKAPPSTFLFKTSFSTSSKGEATCTTTHEKPTALSSDDEDDDSDDDDDEDDEDEDDEDEDDEDDDDDDDEKDNQEASRQTLPQSSSWPSPQTRTWLPRLFRKETGPKPRAEPQPQSCEDKLPDFFKEWMGARRGLQKPSKPGPECEPEPQPCVPREPSRKPVQEAKAVDPRPLFLLPPSLQQKPTPQLQLQPPQQPVEIMRKVPLPAKTTPSTLADDICLFERIKAKPEYSVPKPKTLLLPQSAVIRAATERSQKSVGRRVAKRKAWEPLTLPLPPLKKARTASIHDSEIVYDDNDERYNDNRHGYDNDKEADQAPRTVPTRPGLSDRAPHGIPIDKSRIVMRYTVFRTRRLTDAWDGTLARRTIRTESFLDKRKANKHAESLLPPSGPAVACMELDWGGAGSGRNGMFSSRVKYTDGTFVYIYVDREEQEFGRVDLDELSGNSMGERYKQLCLMPRYDVFAFMRKKVDKKDGSFVIYKFDEMPKPAPVEVEEEDDSDDESRNGEGIGNGSDGDDDQDVDSRPQEYTADPVDEDAAGSHPTTDAVGSPRSDGMQDMDEQEDAPRSPAHSVTNASSVDGDPDPDVYFFFQPIHKGSFTTMAEANAKAIDTFTLLTRPRPPARMDAVFYYKHTLQPAIDEERRELLRDQDANDATQQADLSWKPSPQFGYDYEEINVTVTKSTLEGPLDLTGAF